MFRITALPRSAFADLFALDADALAERGAREYVADRSPGFPCRVSMQDAAPGERVILVPFVHQPAGSPYRASGPVFVRESAETAHFGPGIVPALLRTRLMSVRGYDARDLMIDADVVEGQSLEEALTRMLSDPRVSYLHLHYAKPGCYACRVDRA